MTGVKKIAIEKLTRCDISTGNTYKDDLLVYDKKNDFTFFIIPIPLDCCGYIDWSCIVKYEVYKYKKGSKNWWDNEFIGCMSYMNPQTLRRLRTKYLKKQNEVSKSA